MPTSKRFRRALGLGHIHPTEVVARKALPPLLIRPRVHVVEAPSLMLSYTVWGQVMAPPLVRVQRIIRHPADDRCKSGQVRSWCRRRAVLFTGAHQQLGVYVFTLSESSVTTADRGVHVQGLAFSLVLVHYLFVGVQLQPCSSAGEGSCRMIWSEFAGCASVF
jgi:hypothetical protein